MRVRLGEYEVEYTPEDGRWFVSLPSGAEAGKGLDELIATLLREIDWLESQGKEG